MKYVNTLNYAMRKNIHLIVRHCLDFVVDNMCIVLFWSGTVTFSTKTMNMSETSDVKNK